MGIDITRLGPAAQKQILDKMLAQEAAKAEQKRQKYRNTPTERVMPNGTTHTFDSRKEAARYDELALMLKAGTIRKLKIQPQYTLQESYITAEGERVRALRYTADFSYEQYSEGIIGPEGGGTWVPVVEDVKGGNATKTDTYRMRRKLMHERYGITITEV